MPQPQLQPRPGTSVAAREVNLKFACKKETDVVPAEEKGRAGEQRVTINVPTDDGADGKHKKPLPQTCMTGSEENLGQRNRAVAVQHPHLQRVGTSQHAPRAGSARLSHVATRPKQGCRPSASRPRLAGGGNVTAAGAGAAGTGARRGGSAPTARGGGGRGPLSREYGKHVRITCGRLPPAAAGGPSEGGAGPRSAARRREWGHFKRPPGAAASPCPARSMR